MSADELDLLARELPRFKPDPGRVEEVRTTLLARAADQARAPRRRSIRRSVLVAAFPLAAAAAVVLWFVLDERLLLLFTPPAVPVAVVDTSDSRIERIDEVTYRVRDGRVRTRVSARAPVTFVIGESRIVVLAGALEMRVESEALVSLHVFEGEVRLGDETITDSWSAPAPAPARAPASAPARPPDPVPNQTAAPLRPPAPEATTRRGRTGEREQAMLERAPAPPQRPALPQPTAPGEREFREGWEALRAGDPGRAASSFSAARRLAGAGLAEDASFWEGIALARAGRAGEAARTLRAFLQAYPASSRAGEAAARLGWLLLEAGDLDGAEPLFRRGLKDGSAKIRRNAQDGLDGLARRRAR